MTNPYNKYQNFRSDSANASWLDKDIVIRVRRRTLVGLTLTIALHVGLIILLTRALLQQGKSPFDAHEAAPISLINDTEKPKQKDDGSHDPKPENPLKSMPQPQIDTLAQNIPPIVIEENKPAPVPPPAPSTALRPPPAVDLQAYMDAQREKRRAQQSGNSERVPSAEEVRDENIRRNLQQAGTNGVFRIISKGLSTAQFSFRGWQGSASNQRLEIINVEAGPDNDIERAIVRKMIAIIRQHYTGDFNWESQRLGRVLPLSARPQDNAGLEEFMLREFFAGYRGATR